MLLQRIKTEAVIIHQVEILRLIPNQNLPITIVILNQPVIAMMVEQVNQVVLPIHIILQPEQIQKAIVSLQKLHVHIVVQVILVAVRVIPHRADLQVVVSRILHLPGQPLHLLAQVVEVVPGHQAAEVPDQAEEGDRSLS